MARGRAARRTARGGLRIPASRPHRARLATALGSAAVCALLGAYSAGVAAGHAALVGAIGVAALAVLVASLALGWTSGIAWTLTLLAGEYAAALAARDASTVDAGAPLVGGGLLVVAELAYWSLERRGPGSEEARVVVRRLAALGTLALGSVLLGAFVVVVTAAPLGGGLAWDLVGVLAAAGTLAIVYWLSRQDAREL